VPIAQIPKVMQDAVLAIEDARFYQHGGVDYGRRGAPALAHLREARSQGASTITMQVARNFYLSPKRRSPARSTRSCWPEDREPAEQGPDPRAVHEPDLPGAAGLRLCRGVEIYFGKPLKDLSVAEAAMLAGLPKAPSAYNPIATPSAPRSGQRTSSTACSRTASSPKSSTSRQGQVLRYRTQSRPKRRCTPSSWPRRRGSWCSAQYGEEAYTRGLNVCTDLNAADQMVAYRALRKGLLDFERRRSTAAPRPM
jgi:penicillin-binding protein 1A